MLFENSPLHQYTKELAQITQKSSFASEDLSSLDPGHSDVTPNQPEPHSNLGQGWHPPIQFTSLRSILSPPLTISLGSKRQTTQPIHPALAAIISQHEKGIILEPKLPTINTYTKFTLSLYIMNLAGMMLHNYQWFSGLWVFILNGVSILLFGFILILVFIQLIFFFFLFSYFLTFHLFQKYWTISDQKEALSLFFERWRVYENLLAKKLKKIAHTETRSFRWSSSQDNAEMYLLNCHKKLKNDLYQTLDELFGIFWDCSTPFLRKQEQSSCLFCLPKPNFQNLMSKISKNISRICLERLKMKVSRLDC